MFEYFRPRGGAALAAAFVLFWATPVLSAEAVNMAARPSVAASRISAAEAPTIDGDLSDTAWAKAVVLTEFRQRQPNAGEVPTQRTVLRIMFDENNLYFGVYSYDTNPEQIIVRSMARDSEVFTGDNIGFTLDPGLTRRNAYNFQIGSSGGRLDALRLNNNEELAQWDTIWEARTRQVPDGWIAEVAIPFRSISYIEGQSEWGFEFYRSVRRRNENIRWASFNPALNFADVSEEGTLTGITGVSQGLGLDVQLYGVVRSKHDWSVDGDGAGISGTAGGNAFYKITPGLTGTLTYNTDFSDAPLDAREINTTRFSLFIPETRDFFLQDAGVFEFGSRGFTRGNNDRSGNNARPFFSRNIGLARGVPVSIVAGGKLSGEFGGFGIGALSVLTDDTLTKPGQVLSVARIARPLSEDVRIGAIVTNGDPTGESENTVVGADFQYRISDFLGDETLQTDLYFERSHSSTLGDDDAFGAVLTLPNEPWGADIAFKEVGANFRPALGFVNRTNIRYYDTTFTNRIRYRDGFFRHRGIVARNIFVTDLNDRLESRESRIFFDGETSTNATFAFNLINRFENVPNTFALPGGVPLPSGDYNWTTIGGFYQTSQARTLMVRAELECCAFYDGTSVKGALELKYRPSAYYELEGRYDYQNIDVPGGNVDIHLLSAEGAVNFTPDMQIAFQAQYDNISESFGFLGRYRWEFRPGSELFVALGQSAVIPGTDFRFQVSQLSIRLGHTLRF